MPATVFLDTNVLLRHLLQDHPEQSPRATALVGRIENGEVRVRVADTIVFEVVFTLERSYRIPNARIRDELAVLLDLPGLELPEKRRMLRAFELYVDRNISFADAFHAALIEQIGLTDIVSFDGDFDRVPGIRRIEP